jgi:hypothetical protein
MKLRSVFLLLFFVAHVSTWAQVDSVYTGRPDAAPQKVKKSFLDGEWRNHLIWGSNFQGWVGNPTYINLSPSLGYTFFEHLQVGLGGIYNYTNYRSVYGNYSQSIFGGHSFARLLLGENFFLQFQFDRLKQPNLLSSDPKARTWVNYAVAGIGMRQQMAEHLYLNTSLLYNINASPLSIYRGGFLVQFGVTGSFGN